MTKKVLNVEIDENGKIKRRGKKADGPQKEIAITAASLVDGFCHYSFEILTGVNIGDVVNIKGHGIAKKDLEDAFLTFNRHLACIDDVFKHNSIDIDNIDRMENHELTGLYFTTGFKIGGSKSNRTVVLIGFKKINCSDRRIKIETPKIPLDKLSSYTWYNELLAAVETACAEVEAYRNGKFEAPAETVKDPAQITIADAETMDNEFEKARV